MLTIVGYSINATIVIFDRIRENLADMKKKDTLEGVVNASITQTLTRSIYTSLTTFVMVAVLYVLGVASIKEFALPLMVGIICGAYSSVCITGAPVVSHEDADCEKRGVGQPAPRGRRLSVPRRQFLYENKNQRRI